LNVVNDWQKSFANTVCRWAVVDEKGREAASGDCALDVPMDAISDSVAIAIPPLEPGRYRLSLKLYSAAGDLLGENRYEFHATQERVTPAIVGAGPYAHPLFVPQLNCGTPLGDIAEMRPVALVTTNPAWEAVGTRLPVSIAWRADVREATVSNWDTLLSGDLR